MSTRRWDEWFRGAAILLLGGVLGGAFGLIPFLSTDPSPSRASKVVYFGLLGVGVLLSAICGAAGLAIKSERDESVSSIKEAVDDLLKPYEKDLTAS